MCNAGNLAASLYKYVFCLYEVRFCIPSISDVIIGFA